MNLKRKTYIIVCLLKIDIEGAEYAVISILAPYLAIHKPNLLLSVHKRQMVNWYGYSGVIRAFMGRVKLLWQLMFYSFAYGERRSELSSSGAKITPLGFLGRMDYFFGLSKNYEFLFMASPYSVEGRE